MAAAAAVAVAAVAVAEPDDRARQTGPVNRPLSPEIPADPSAPAAGGSAASAPADPYPPSPDRVIPTWVDPVAIQASEAVGGPWGRHAVTGRALFWTPLRVCLLFTTLVLALAWIKEVPCSDGNWPGHKQYTHVCYTDAVPLFSVHGLDTGKVPYLDSAVVQTDFLQKPFPPEALVAKVRELLARPEQSLPHTHSC